MYTDYMQKIDSTNTLFSLASDLVNHTSKNIFLTGKAGTGKTTFLKYIKENCPKKMVIVAPTGVAAINAGGVTIHSFFSLLIISTLPYSRYNVLKMTLRRYLLRAVILNGSASPI